MSTAIDFAVRDAAGGIQHGIVSGADTGNFIQIGAGDTVSLNISQASVVSYQQVDGDLVIELVDGRVIVLQGWFDQPVGLQTLYLSSNGTLDQVYLTDAGDGMMSASYSVAESYGEKWSPLDGLRHDGPDVLAAQMGATDEPAGMGLFAPALLGMGGSGALLGGAALVGGAALLDGDGNGAGSDGSGGGGNGGGGNGGGGNGGGGNGGGGNGGGGGGGGGGTPPTVNGVGTTTTLTTNTTNPSITVTGTGAPGDTVQVVIGGKTGTTTIGNDGKWSVNIPGNNLPPDGNHTAQVTFGHSGGGSTKLSGPGFVIDMTPPAVAMTDGTQSTGDVENLAEWQDGVTLTGSGEPGARISVTIAGKVETTTVAADGSWSVNFANGDFAAGERTHAVTVTATDALGNRTTISDVLVMDTVPNALSIATVGGDNRLNHDEVRSTVTIGGATVAGATVEITIEGVAGTFTRTADANGNWSLDLPPNTFPNGTYDRVVTVTTQDAAGNPSSQTRTLRIDTENTVSFDSTANHAVLRDGWVNLQESQGSITLTGKAEAGSQWVRVAWLGGDIPAQVDAQGNWTVTLPAGSAGTVSRDSNITVTSMDAAGNPAIARLPVRIDLESRVNPELTPVGPDNILNASERAAGFVLDGMADPNARVEVRVNGVPIGFANADATGAWSLQLNSSHLPSGASGTGTISVRATDPAGNISDWVERRFDVDTVADPAPLWAKDFGGGGQLDGLATYAAPGTYSYHAIDANGTVRQISTTNEIARTVDHEGRQVASDFVFFNDSVPDGSYLVIQGRDAAGNEASTLYLRTTGETTVNLNRPGLQQFDIAAIDLSSSDANLTITEQQIVNITGPDRTLVIRGGADDVVNMAGAVLRGTETIGNHTFAHYTLGSATLYVDTDIQRNNGVV